MLGLTQFNIQVRYNLDSQPHCKIQFRQAATWYLHHCLMPRCGLVWPASATRSPKKM